MISDYGLFEAVQALREQFPELTLDGLCGNPVPYHEVVADVFKNRHQIDKCIEWLGECEDRVGFDTRFDTYVFKHEVERWAGFWISHLAMLTAAASCGWELRAAADRPWASELKIKTGRPGQL